MPQHNNKLRIPRQSATGGAGYLGVLVLVLVPTTLAVGAMLWLSYAMLVALGTITVTPDASVVMYRQDILLCDFLERHKCGDWGGKLVRKAG